ESPGVAASRSSPSCCSTSSAPSSNSQGISGGARNRQAASSVASICRHIDAPCVLACRPPALARNARPLLDGALMPSRRVTEFLLFAAVFTMSFEKLFWNVAGKIALTEVISILFIGAYLLRRLGSRDWSLPRTSGIVIAFFAAFLLVYLIGFYNLE